MFYAIFFLVILNVIYGFPGKIDEVIILPGLNIQPTFKHYSGYLNGSETRRLHYWFVTSQRNSDKDPLTLWFNGGPGCSSLLGFLTEHGPFRVHEQGYLVYNPYSWNKMANIIYLESPVCVGFSFSVDGKCDADDDSTSLLNFNALKHFFIKFPQFKGRDFYISGESYAGFYIPILAEKIILSKDIPYIQFKGIIIGNAYSDVNINENGNFHFAYNHGLISDSIWVDIVKTCCRNIDPIHCNITGSLDKRCSEKVKFAQSVYNKINPYNIYTTCLTTTIEEHSIWAKLNVSSNYDRVKIMMGFITDNEKHLLQLKREYMLLKLFRSTFGTDIKNSDIPCIPDIITNNFLNQNLVRTALHIPKTLPPWTVCSDTLEYRTIYKNMDRQYNTMFTLKDFKIWIYNGDIDMVCSFLSEEWYFEQFNRRVVKSRSAWIYKDENNASQVGGFVKIYDKFVLLTVRGSGHMVPTDKPLPAYHMFQSFLNNSAL